MSLVIYCVHKTLAVPILGPDFNFNTRLPSVNFVFIFSILLYGFVAALPLNYLIIKINSKI
jgi:hypothetical protein